MGLLDQAKAAHDQRRSEAAANQLAVNNAVLKRKLKEIFGLDVEPVNNRHVEDGLTLMCHDDGDLHVLQQCPKCHVEYRSFHTIRSLADLHLAASEPVHTHPPCNGIGAQAAVTLDISPAQVIKA